MDGRILKMETSPSWEKMWAGTVSRGDQSAARSALCVWEACLSGGAPWASPGRGCLHRVALGLRAVKGGQRIY